MVRRRELAHGDYRAEIFVDSRSTPMLFHFIVTSIHAAEILSWGQELSLEAAEKSAMDSMLYLSNRPQGSGAVT